MFKNKSLNFKLRFSFGALIVILLTVGLVSVHFLDKTSTEYRHVTHINLPNAIALGNLESSSREILRRLLQYSIPGNTAEDFKRIDESIAKEIKDYEENDKAYGEVKFVEGEAVLYESVNSSWKAMLPYFEELPKLAKSTKEEDHARFAQIYRVEMKEAREKFFKSIDALTDFQVAQSHLWINKAESTAKLADTITMISVVAGFIFGALIAYFISNGLTIQLRSLAVSLSEGATIVAEAADNIAHSSEELSSAVNEQAAAVQETTASTEELSAMVKKNQENAQQSNVISKQSATTAGEGKRSLEEMIEAIGAIDKSNQKMMTSVEASNTNISEIINVIHEISNKTKVINEIVFQTKLLSFNASVEAARAGEQGKGFAVVAEEVGNLAQMSGNAAQEISDMLNNSIAKVEGIVNQTKSEVGVLMIEGKSKVQHGITVAKRCNDVLDEIVGHVSEVDTMVGEITIASDEQSKGISEISRAMGQLDQATQVNADSSRMMASSSEELSGQAKKLSDLVTDLKYTVEGRFH